MNKYLKSPVQNSFFCHLLQTRRTKADRVLVCVHLEQDPKSAFFPVALSLDLVYLLRVLDALL